MQIIELSKIGPFQTMEKRWVFFVFYEVFFYTNISTFPDHFLLFNLETV